MTHRASLERCADSGDDRMDSNQAGSTGCVLANCRLTTVLSTDFTMGDVVVSTELVAPDLHASLMNLMIRDGP